MAQEPETERSASGIARAAKRKWGYDAEQVDAFLERAHMLYEGEGAQLTQHDIQNVSFELVKGGYVIAQVDAALARLERAVVDKQTTWEISQHGRVAWKAQTEDLFKKLDAHAEREPGERFKPGEGKNPSYDRKQVDRVIDKCLTKAAGELGLEQISEEDSKAIADVNAQTISNVVFTQRKGKRGYDERQVDYYLAACGQLLTRLESYARVADFVGEPSEEAQSNIAPASVDGNSPMITPLFANPAAAAPSTGTAPSAPAVPFAAASNEKDPFDALNKAEHEIFTSAVASPVSAPTVKTNAPTVPPVVPPVFHPQTATPSSKPKMSEETQVFNPLADSVPQAAAPQTPTVQPVPSEPETGSYSSLAALAHLAHTVNAANVTENTFTPQVPNLAMSETTKPAATSSLGSLAASVPPSFAPEPAAPAASAAPAPVTPPASPAPVAPAAPAVTTSQPKPSESAVPSTKPAAPAPEPPAQTKQKTDKPVQPLFPASIDSTNLDIPDLSFPSFD